MTQTSHKVAREAIILGENFHVVATETLSFSAKIDPNGFVGGSGDEELIVFNQYDQLGKLIAKKVGGVPGTEYGTTLGLQTVDYAYNIRGWLTAINGGADATPEKLFNFRLMYDDAPTDPLYNGNISAVRWRTDNDDKRLKSYAYSYDALNRITGATDNTGKYNVSGITYDKMGNIQKLKREGWTVASPSLANNTGFGTMDDLTYTYQPNSNKLAKVADAAAIDQYGFRDDAVNTASDGMDDYLYDLNGNMVRDDNKGITSITYNHLNLPEQIGINNTEHTGNIQYIYDATGTKLRKIATDNGESSVTTTDYAGNYIYENTGSGFQLQFFSHPEGYVSAENGSYKYVYQYKDHLGNIRLSYSDEDGDGDILVSTDPLETEIIEENNYYPFGLKHKGYNFGTAPLGNPVAQSYKFGGKELDESFNGTLSTYDFGARNYDPALGRWMNIDPLAENYDYLSPYVYTANNPVFYIDPDGQRIAIYGDEKYRNKVLFQLALLAASSDTGNDLVMNAINNKRTLLFADIEGELGNNTFDGVGGQNLEGEYNVVGYNAEEEGFLDSDNGRNGEKLFKNSSTTLAHELGHFESITTGNERGLLLDNQGRASYDRSDEVYAVERENSVRRELGLDERTHYGGRNVYGKQVQRTDYLGYFKLATKKDYAIKSQNQQTHNQQAGATARQIYYSARTKDYRGGYSHFGSEISNRAKKPTPGKQLILDGIKD